MIQIDKKSVGEISILNVVQTEKINEKLPTVIYYHGFNGEKESSLTLAYKIAKKGFRVILPDSILHGERGNGTSQNERDLAFWNIVMQNISELQLIKDYLEREGLTIPDRIGIGGTSMGGITTYGALKKYRWIKAATVLMGTPQMTAYASILLERYNRLNERKITEEEAKQTLTKLEPYDLSFDSEKLESRPLLIWHGEKDAIVPLKHSETFYNKIENEYEDKEKLKLIIEKDRIHNITRLSMEGTADWFNQHL
ncbi:prolyl oligopeptidase family serine peptidase [Pseudogracilibacillus auburnensis]|uniref:Peptidase S9 prolyl oligopeptidase catalytic domain-containing protein n=1 Tax=Pseudogracilibacillus auburnensis TaxID=1494959 RepID=A0A2V3W4T0_9BACI|nr:prolyl oligopeptidase family serine peptidase [Pseudogracilibacillus auburnensis]MBO1003619.1 prolyl oligopeptidase family serine peptidase [Pseudogracilibacillus auburnensis]PXW89307.1 hypothetical protein DFR56_10283 [Pseudogracilibacillus auburnensis]